MKCPVLLLTLFINTHSLHTMSNNNNKKTFIIQQQPYGTIPVNIHYLTHEIVAVCQHTEGKNKITTEVRLDIWSQTDTATAHISETSQPCSPEAKIVDLLKQKIHNFSQK